MEKREYLGVLELDPHRDEEEGGKKDRDEAEGSSLLHCIGSKIALRLRFLCFFSFP